MNTIVETLKTLANQLNEQSVEWALIGGLAVSARCEPRTTRDVDVVVSVADDDQAEGLVHALGQRGLTIQAVIEQRRANRLSTARMELTKTRVFVDLLFASSGIEKDIAHEADQLEIVPGLTLPVARIGHLVTLKLLARDDRTRPQDWDDLKSLLKEADEDDLNLARRAVQKVEASAYSRG